MFRALFILSNLLIALIATFPSSALSAGRRCTVEQRKVSSLERETARLTSIIRRIEDRANTRYNSEARRAQERYQNAIAVLEAKKQSLEADIAALGPAPDILTASPEEVRLYGRTLAYLQSQINEIISKESDLEEDRDLAIGRAVDRRDTAFERRDDFADLLSLKETELDESRSALAECLDHDPDPGNNDFVRGDSNQDGKINISDVVQIIEYIAGNIPAKSELDASDINDDGEISIKDAIYLFDYLYKHGAKPKAPFPEAGRDPTADLL